MRAYQLYRNAVRLGCRYRFVGALLCVFLLGSLARVLTHSPPSEIKEDSPRFVYQSTQLVAGNGYLFNGRACTELPPGYPVFLAGLRIFLETWYRVVVSQGIISVALSLCLVAVLYKSDRRLGFWAAFLIVVNPWCAYCDWKIMSETLGVSLSIAAIVLHLLLSEASTNMGRVTFGFLFAVVTMALVLTCPGTIFVATFLLGWQCLKFRKQPLFLAAAFAGFMVTMGLWQGYVFQNTGNIAPRVLTGKTGSLYQENGLQIWNRAWKIWPVPPHASSTGVFIWDTPGIEVDDLPPRAFRNAEEKQMLTDRLEEWRATGTPTEERQTVFKTLAEARKADEPIHYHVVMPLVRCVALWLDMPQVKHAQLSYVTRLSPASFAADQSAAGTKHAVLRLAKSGVSVAALAVHLMYLALFCVGVIYVVRYHDWWGIGVTLGVFGYAFASSYFCLSEMRRNWPFVPFLVFLGIKGLLVLRDARVERRISRETNC